MIFYNIKKFSSWSSVRKLLHLGGCEIGPRPIDIHLKALREMGVKIDEAQRGWIHCVADKIIGKEIQLDFPSVGATENIMLAAVFAEGETIIRNAAKEPEIVDLQNYLLSIGVKITGAGSGIIRIQGTNEALSGAEHTVIPDRIVAGTYMVAAAMTNGEITLHKINTEHLAPITSGLIKCGCKIDVYKSSIHIIGAKKLKEIELIRTLPYPGFPTDMQAQMLSMLSIADGTSIIVETIFENRYKHVEELMKMGANIKLEGRIAIIKGVKKLIGAKVFARDLRGGAALILAGLVAEGETVVFGTEYIDRGYEKIENKLKSLGADIKRKDNIR